MKANGKARLIGVERERVENMTNKPAPICGEHKIEKKWKPITFEYNEDGINIEIPNVYAWVCPESGEASFTPDTVDELIATVRELIAIAKRARKRRPVLTEYIVSVSA